jgi:hypothetical protein
MKNVLSTLVLIFVLLVTGYLAWTAFNRASGPLPLNQNREIEGMLAADLQVENWNNEQIAFLFEHEFGQEFVKAWKSRNAQTIREWMGADFVAGIMQDSSFNVRTAPLLTESSRTLDIEQEGASDEADEFIGILLALSKRFDVFEHVEFDVVTCFPGNKSIGTATVNFNVCGVDKEQKPLQYEAVHSFYFRTDVLLGQSQQPLLIQWSFDKETFRESNQYLMEEVTESSGLSGFDFGDNLKSDSKSRPLLHRFQFAVEDFDRDYDLDIAITTLGGDRILLKNEAGRFQDVAAAMSLQAQKESDRYRSSATAWVDLDNDGFPELISGSEIFKNESGTEFRLIESGLELEWERTTLTIADVNRDGFLDISALRLPPLAGAKYNSPNKSETLAIYLNNQDLTFTKQLIEAANIDSGNSVSWLYSNDDLLPDAFVSSSTNSSKLIFGAESGLGTVDSTPMDTGLSHGAAIGDFNNDGAQDLFVAGVYSAAGRRLMSYAKTRNKRQKSMIKSKRKPLVDLVSIDRLSIGNLVFQSEEKPAVPIPDAMKQVGWTWGPTVADFDSDGDLDIYMTSGFKSHHRDVPSGDSFFWKSLVTMPSMPFQKFPKLGELLAGEVWNDSSDVVFQADVNLAEFERNRLFLNDTGGFLDASFASRADLVADSRSAVSADFDGDGKVDLLVGSDGGGSLRLLKNTMPQGNRLQMRFIGKTSNRSGIGAKVVAEFGDGQKIYRDVFPANGCSGTSPAEAWLGIGDAEKISRLTIQWPSGELQEFTDVGVNRIVEASEEETKLNTIKSFE